MNQNYKRETAMNIRKRIIDLQAKGARTSKGEKVSFASIGRTLDPPVTRTAVSLVVDGKAESKRIKRAIERELGKVFWIRKG